MGTLPESSGHLDRIIDETSCGSLCQHPACWSSNQRQEKGFPFKRERSACHVDYDLELPKMTVYNILDDYGEDPNHAYPTQRGGQTSCKRVSSSLPELPAPAQQYMSEKVDDAIPAITSSNETKIIEPVKGPHMKVVEVQEVFDVEDLNSQWDETFITSPYYVWVPKPKASSAKATSVDPSAVVSVSKVSNTGKPKHVHPKDVTEQLIPEDVERQREEAKVKKYASVHSGHPVYSRGSTFSRGAPGTQRSARQFIDVDSLRALLDLPKDVLMHVLEQMKESDLSSKEKIQDAISQVRPPTERQVSPTSIGTSEILQQKKVRLLGSKERNFRNPDLMMTKPVFQMDASSTSGRTIEVKMPIRDVLSDSGSSKDELSIKGLPRFKKPLPAIQGTASAAAATAKSDIQNKLPSISLGLPELPSGIRQTRPFMYKKQQNVDFSLGPVLTPPESGRSSDLGGSDHGTTVRANVTSASTRLQDKDPYAYDKGHSREENSMTDSCVPMRGMSPSTSVKVPNTPMATPVTRSSPTKLSFQRDRTNTSGALRSSPPSRDINMSPVQKVVAPANSPNQSPGTSPEPGNRGLVTIPETIMEDGSVRQKVPSPGKMVSFDRNVVHPTGNEGYVYTITIKKSTQDKGTDTPSDRVEPFRRSAQSPGSVSSNDEWPIVNESVYETAPYPHSTGIRPASDELMRLSSAERNSKTPGSKTRSNLGSRESDKSSVARMMLEENVKPESPGPPPPSPEPKNRKKMEDKKRKEMKSRESLSMTPLYEESELAEHRVPEDSAKFDPGVMTTVSQVTPQPKSGPHEISVNTFVNVDIQADSIIAAEDGEGETFRSEEPPIGLSGITTERTETESEKEVLTSEPVPLEPSTDEYASQNVNYNRAESVSSKSDTVEMKDAEPDQVTEKLDLSAVNYDNEDDRDSIEDYIYEDEGEDDFEDIVKTEKSTEDVTAEPMEAELGQESSILDGEKLQESEPDINVEKEIPLADRVPQVDPSLPQTEDDVLDHENELSKLNPAMEYQLQEAVNSHIDEHRLTDSENDRNFLEHPLQSENMHEASAVLAKTFKNPTCTPERREPPEGQESAVDTSIPPPVSRTNTAIEIVRTVIETATVKVDELIQSGQTPEDEHKDD